MSNFETPKMPEVKFNKNGYEIRTEILGMAKQMAEFEYSAKFQGWEMSTARDEKTGQYVTTVGMPQVPGLEQILQNAEKMYAFVNAAGQIKK
ncbi:MAG: hypothetical protein EBV10_01005 [Synechococcaceae bacterium WB6_1A_059]|nr:hypothetical protein [Synechococcaceae bacterium WB6_1A_059]